MKHEMQPDSLVDLKFIMADTGFGKTFIYDRIKSGDLPKAKLIHGRARWLYSDHCKFREKLLSSSDG
ncbi:AlpA family transcriptional regulator [Klebsiella quasipneumoniae]|uniref:helix-turn-helix transcriptional regulator n=1 Tax=Klebsiella quasipneumoniae TaxID=1463165 RepID=UPI002181D794|nr:excisionase [Klebsiella quasipneumoniae]HCF8317246.1 excisionase [Klebsiella pneumoniae]EIY5092124.1 excisionase [Klebsiella quasipneumoniae]GKQ09351.1 transcriptional regulator [Klebsiella quasipneumoniae]HCF8131618.1 excisionase [Klebsiella quasipneumoniae]HCF8561446.1 excisionase [Klebsiella pneumoniae]